VIRVIRVVSVVRVVRGYYFRAVRGRCRSTVVSIVL
jgi:hypothetical protein